jgi:hypothetical protein
MLSKQSFPASEQDKKAIYGKFRILGANIDKLKQLGLAVPELEQLLKRLESVQDKKLVRFITTITQGHIAPTSTTVDSASKKIQKTCPRCSRELTEANIIKENSYYIEDFIQFVVVCECGYIRELRKPAVDIPTLRQSTLQEFAGQ